jgi:hypothetical protein
MKISKSIVAAVGALLVSGLALPQDAAAGSRASTANAVARCQGALPSYEGAIRKRPLAVQNEGGISAFVTCAFLTDQANVSVEDFGVYASTTNGQAATLNCTAIVGYQTGGPLYAAKSVALSETGQQSSIFWSEEDFGGPISPNLPVSLSCSLAPGVGLNDMYFNYDDGY